MISDWNKNLQLERRDFNQIMQLRNQLVIAVENFTGEEHLPPLLILAHKVVDVVNQANTKICDSAAVKCVQGRKFLCSSPTFGK